MIEVEKQPTESWPLAFEFKDALPSGLTLASGAVSAIRLDTGAADNSILASLVMTINGTQAIVRIQAGTSGVDYKVTAVVTLSDTLSTLEEDLLLHVVQR